MWTWVSQYQNVSILDFIGAKGDGGGGENWSNKTCKSPVKSSPPTNQHPVFYWPDSLPNTIRNSNSECGSQSNHRMPSSLPPGHWQTFATLWTYWPQLTTRGPPPCCRCGDPGAASRLDATVRKTWLRAVEADLGLQNIGLASAWRKAAIRDDWRRIVDTATLQRSMYAIRRRRKIPFLSFPSVLWHCWLGFRKWTGESKNVVTLMCAALPFTANQWARNKDERMLLLDWCGMEETGTGSELWVIPNSTVCLESCSGDMLHCCAFHYWSGDAVNRAWEILSPF